MNVPVDGTLYKFFFRLEKKKKHFHWWKKYEYTLQLLLNTYIELLWKADLKLWSLTQPKCQYISSRMKYRYWNNKPLSLNCTMEALFTALSENWSLNVTLFLHVIYFKKKTSWTWTSGFRCCIPSGLRGYEDIHLTINNEVSDRRQSWLLSWY